MPAKSKKQKKFMQAVANNPKFAKKVGVKQSVGKKFTKEKDMKKGKKMNMGGLTADAAGARAMDPKMAMAMEAQRRQAAMGGMKDGGKVKNNPGMAKLKKVAPKVAKQMGYKKGGSVSSASKRADGIAQRGRTKGRMV